MKRSLIYSCLLYVLIGTYTYAAERVVSLHTQQGNVQHVNAEFADNDHLRAYGLMHRNHLPEHAGMLFTYDPPQLVHMWMKNTLIPLDILFIDEHGQIVHIVHHAKPHDETPLSSLKPIQHALEVNGGYARAHNIAVGDIVTIKDIP